MSLRLLIIKVSYCCIILFIVGSLFYLHGCSSNPDTRKNPQTLEGEMLIQKYCSSCHLPPGPQLLDQATWVKNVLPEMGKKLGISRWSDQYFQEDMHSGISVTEWQKIVDYYAKNSPKKLGITKAAKPVLTNGDFKIVKPFQSDTINVASTTMVIFNAAKGRLFTADVLSESLFEWDTGLKLKNRVKFASPVVDLSFFNDENTRQNEALITSIGIMNPVDISRGTVLKTIKGNFNNVSTLGETLPRPVNSVTADFNKDGLTDIVVCGFGHNTGGLYLLTQVKGKSYSKTILSPRTGATRSYTGDFNKDGWPDVICLFAQEDEGIWMYLNDKKGGFKSVKIMRFPPVYGSSSFQVIDFDKDGLDDILYTCGDNSDFSKILKPYHGVYIYLNKGGNKFSQSFFYPINGCSKVMATDLNKDGKLDLTTIAFFADYKGKPQESFMYFMQNQKKQLVPHTLSIEKLGKWICMDINDMNADGYPDIVLGNFSLGGFNQTGTSISWDTKTPFTVLLNQFKAQLN
jgi:hypothetical protein